MNHLKSSILVLTIGLIACGGGNTENTALDTLGAQLQMLEDTMLTEEGMSWTAADWETINGTYDSNVKLAEEGGADVAEFTTRWDAIAAKVMEATEEDFSAEEYATTENVATSANITAAYGALAIDATDTEFSTITKDNILAAYQGFVRTVSENFSKYNASDVQVITALWGKLNDRKNALEPINKIDNARIATLKIEYSALKIGLKASAIGEEAAE